MEEEAVHPLDQLIAAARKADADKSEPVFTVDEKGRMSDYRGKQESTATTRKRNTDVVFKQTSTMPGKGYRKIDGEQLLRFLSQDAIIAGKSPDVTTFFPRVANEKGNFVKSKQTLEIDPNVLYWWKDDKRMVHSMVDTDLQATLFEAQRSDLQGTGKNVSASGAVRGEEGILPKGSGDIAAVKVVADKYNVPVKSAVKTIGNMLGKIIDPIETAIVSSLTAIGLGALAANYARYEAANFAGNMIIGAGRAGARAQLAQSAIIGEALGLDVDSKDYTEGMEIDMLIDFVDQIGTATTMSPAMQIEQKGLDFLGPKVKAAMGAFTDG